MRIYMNDMLYAVSYALDCVEQEFLGARSYHSGRVAYLCVELGRRCGLADCDLLALAAAAVLHDNALTEYVSLRQSGREDGGYLPETKASPKDLRVHCELGERNVHSLPFYERIQGAVLYHHENADGSGPYGKLPAATPLFSRLIHLGDHIDNRFHLDQVDTAKYQRILAYLERHKGQLFDDRLVELFPLVFPAPFAEKLAGGQARQLLQDSLPHLYRDYDAASVEALAAVFAKIIDYKSHFTCTHSQGIAKKARDLGAYRGMEPAVQTKLYLAGALHDIGKLTIPNAILEKPDQLTEAEFEIVKTHALASWKILSPIDGLEDTARWAAYHHEKLNGQGYPFGLRAADLDRPERLMACVDIYQALTEARPYKAGFSHEKSMRIMYGMVQNGFIDGEITAAVDRCFAVQAAAGTEHAAKEGEKYERKSTAVL